jgi:hypothetical protein
MAGSLWGSQAGLDTLVSCGWFKFHYHQQCALIHYCKYAYVQRTQRFVLPEIVLAKHGTKYYIVLLL